MFNEKNLLEDVSIAIRSARRGAGGISDHTVLHRGKRFLLVESSITAKTHDGRLLQSETHDNSEGSELSIIFATRGGDETSHVDFAILNGEEQICATSQDVERLSCFAGFCEHGKRKAYGLCVLAVDDGSKQRSNVLITEEPQAIQFMKTVAAYAGGVKDA